MLSSDEFGGWVTEEGKRRRWTTDSGRFSMVAETEVATAGFVFSFAGELKGGGALDAAVATFPRRVGSRACKT